MRTAAATLVSVPTLDGLADNPALASDLPADTLAALAARCAAIQAALAAAQFAVARTAPVRGTEHLAAAPDRMLNEDEIAAELGQSRRWVFRNAKNLPFVRRVSRKALVASEAALRRWREAQKA